MKLSQVLSFPLHVLALFTGKKSFVDNPLIGSRWLNQRGLHRQRCAIAARLCAWRRGRLASGVAPADRKVFDANGLVIKPGFLPAEVFEGLRREILEQTWETLEMQQGPALTRQAPLDLATLAQRAPCLAQFVHSPEVVNLIGYAAGTAGQPVFSLQAIITEGRPAGDDPQCEPHADTFHAAAKAWFFLDDVAADQGPFFYVPGSHRRTRERLDWEQRMSVAAASHSNIYHARGSFRAGDADLTEMGFAKPQLMCVHANTLVVADTSGFHGRTPSPKPTLRVEIYATLRRNPFLPWLGLHFLGLPIIRGRLGSLNLEASRWLHGKGLRWVWPRGGKKLLAGRETK